MDDLLAEVIKRYLLMLKALEAVEWVEQHWGNSRVCAWCGNYKDEGHRTDCQRQAALGLNVEV